jgi:bacterioferritin (cytochrome b1)
MRGQYLQVIEAIQQRTHDEASRGPTHAGRKGELEFLRELLAEALSAESVCETECRRLAHIAHHRQIEWLAQSLDQHAEQQRRLVERIAKRIRELGGTPPVCVTAAENILPVENDALSDLLDEEFEVEKIAVNTCGEIAERLGDVDPDARAMIEEAMEVERAHLAQLSRLVQH